MSYSDRVEFQRFLDETFPDGAWVSVLSGQRAGVQIGCGRVFVQGDRTFDGVLIQWQLLCDPWVPTTDQPDGGLPPITPWVAGLWPVEGVEHVLLEGQVHDDVTGDEIEGVVVRLLGTLEGPRVLPPEARAEATERWERELFPEGLEVRWWRR